MDQSYPQRARLYKAFCDENRLQIIDLLTTGEHCACDLLDQLQISQSTLSHHMHILLESGIVEARRSGKWIHYGLSDSGRIKAVEELNVILTKKENGAILCACEDIHETNRD